jgi:flagellin
VAVENITRSESTIRELDFAADTAQFTKTQILFQAGTAVLASANLIPQTILSLLQ